jgi:DnaJ domain/WD domain, G-beta repeat
MAIDSGVVFPVAGGVTGAGVSASLGGIGLVGSFGGASLGIVGLTGIGIVTGSALYGAIKGLEEDDPAAWLAFGTGSLGGVGIWANIGGIGLGVQGISLGVGAGSMAIAGGIFGLGAYGLYTMFARSSSDRRFYQNLEFFDRLTREYEEELFWQQLAGEIPDIEEELKALKEEISTNEEVKNDFTAIALTDRLSWQCFAIFKGHTASVNSVAMSPDGECMASAGDDRSIKLWNLKTGKWLYSFTGISEEIQAIAFSPDGKAIVAGGFDRRISYWHLETRKYWSSFFARSNLSHSHDSIITALVFSPDEKYIISASADKTIRVWGKYTGELKRILNGHRATVNTIAISPDSQTIASGSDDGTICLWRFDNSNADRIFSHASAINSLSFTADGEYLISGDRLGSIAIWNYYTGEMIKNWLAHDTEIISIAVNPRSTLLASASNREIKLWNYTTREFITMLIGMAPIQFSQDGKILASGSYGSQIKIWCEMINTRETCLLEFDEWWEIFSVSKNAYPAEVKRIYRTLARQYHPDVNPSRKAIHIMQKINRAYEDFLQDFSQGI